MRKYLNLLRIDYVAKRFEKFDNKGVKDSQKAKLISRDPSMFYADSAGAGKLLPQDGLLGVLKKTMGVVFPYSPTIQTSHTANYGTHDITHSVYQPHYYTSTNNPMISMFAPFAAQTQDDAQYMAAALHFFKSCTKSDFGEANRNIGGGLGTAGTPPPVLLFSAYGSLNYRNVPVVIKSVSYTFPEDVDFVTFKYTTDTISIPTQMIINLELGVQITPTRTRSFNIQKYRHGEQLGRGFV